MTQMCSDDVLQALRRYSSMVYRLAYARTRSRADAEDVYQEVFLSLAKCETAFESDEQMKAWLLRATANRSVNLFRSAWRRYVQTVEAIPESAEQRESGERFDALNRALDGLPSRYRTVIHLYYYEEMTVDEISAALDVKPATIRSRLARGRERLKVRLTESREVDVNAEGGL